MCKTIAVSNLKGGVGKTMTAASLGVGFARMGRKTLIIDCDSQHSLTVSFGVSEPQKMTDTLSVVMLNIINEAEFEPKMGIINHSEGADLLSANGSLAGIELALVQTIGRETVLSRYVERIKSLYDYIILDCAPSLGLLTINALAAADGIIIPVCPKFLDTKGLELLLKSVAQIQKQINPSLEIWGILLTMADMRANFTKEVISSINKAYGERIRIFTEHIPRSVKVTEASANGVSIFRYDPNGKVAAAYNALVREALLCG